MYATPIRMCPIKISKARKRLHALYVVSVWRQGRNLPQLRERKARIGRGPRGVTVENKKRFEFGLTPGIDLPRKIARLNSPSIYVCKVRMLFILYSPT